MKRARLFLRQVNSVLFPSRKVQCRAGMIKNYSTGHNEIGNTDNKVQYVRPTSDIPGPKRLPLLGSWFRFMPYIGEYHNVNVLTLMRMLRDKYGNIVKLEIPTKERLRIFLFCPELCKNMYQLQGKWPMRVSMEPLYYYRKSREYIYNGQYGLVLSQGESWQEFRSKVNPHMMRPEIIRTHVTQIHEVTSEFVDKMRALRDPETLELPYDFMNELFKWSLESKCSYALNSRLGFLKPNLAMDSEPQIMINCIRETLDLTYRLENLPSLWKVYNTRNFKKLFHAMDTIHAITGKYIEHTKAKFMQRTDNTNSEDLSILEKLLYIDRQTAHIMALDTLISSDTTSNAAGALLYYIANNTKKQEKLREEVMSVLPNETMPVTHDMLKRIPYVKACIKESMRLFPIASDVLRTMQTNVSIGGYMIPKGSDILACHSLISLDSTYFPRPKEYIPERWIRGSPEFLLYQKSHLYAYMPFGYGVRSCIGQRFAEMELEILLLKVMRNFRIEWHHGSLEHESQLVNTVKSPLQLKLIDL